MSRHPNTPSEPPSNTSSETPKVGLPSSAAVPDAGASRGVSTGDVGVFMAELAVYVSVGWWGATRAWPLPVRVLVAALALAVMATAWGVFASPRAPRPLSGARAATFKAVWFLVGALALFAVVRGS